MSTTGTPRKGESGEYHDTQDSELMLITRATFSDANLVLTIIQCGIGSREPKSKARWPEDAVMPPKKTVGLSDSRAWYLRAIQFLLKEQSIAKIRREPDFASTEAPECFQLLLENRREGSVEKSTSSVRILASRVYPDYLPSPLNLMSDLHD